MKILRTWLFASDNDGIFSEKQKIELATEEQAVFLDEESACYLKYMYIP